MWSNVFLSFTLCVFLKRGETRILMPNPYPQQQGVAQGCDLVQLDFMGLSDDIIILRTSIVDGPL